MISLKQDILLQSNTSHLIIFKKDIFPNCFDSIPLLVGGESGEINFSKCALSKLALDLKVFQINISWSPLLQSGGPFEVFSYLIDECLYICAL